MGDLPPFVIDVAAGLCWLAGYIYGSLFRNLQREIHRDVLIERCT